MTLIIRAEDRDADGLTTFYGHFLSEIGHYDILGPLIGPRWDTRQVDYVEADNPHYHVLGTITFIAEAWSYDGEARATFAPQTYFEAFSYDTTYEPGEFDNWGSRIFDLRDYILAQSYDFVGTNVADDFRGGALQGGVAYLGGGADAFIGSIGDDKAYGELGDDYLLGGEGNDTLYGAAGRDILSGEDGNDALHGGNGDDTLEGGSGDDTLYGGPGADFFVGGDGYDIVSYQNAAAGVRLDLYYGNNSGEAAGDSFSWVEEFKGSRYADTMLGDAGNDILRGGEGADDLGGDGGHDKLYGDGGNDLLRGGAGNDKFFFVNAFGHDRISDFDDLGKDQLRLRASTAFDTFAEVAAVMSQQDDDVLIDFGSRSIRLEDTALADINASDFIFF